MLSSLFRRDYEQLTAQGVVFTPEDIVRLNALAVRIRLTQHAAQTVHLPRLAFMPRDSRFRAPLVLREPTVAHELWIEEASRWIDAADERNFLWLHAYALSRRAEELPDAFDPKKLVKAVYRFAAKKLCRFTMRQLSAAVEYALFGANWTVGERGPVQSAECGVQGDALTTNHQPLTTSPSPTLGLLVNARAVRLPISLDDAKKMTASELEEAILRARIRDGDYDREQARNEAFAEYVRAREEIRARATRTTEAAPSEPKDQK